MLTPRWYPLKPHPEQRRLLQSPARFKVVPAGRRSGKTERAKRFLVFKALKENEAPWRERRYFAAAPTRDQARAIFWEDLKALSPRAAVSSISESHLMIHYKIGSVLAVVGLDKPERIEGVGWDGGVLDEYGNMKARAWPQHVRPALSDRGGWCWLIGVPEGRNHYYQTDKAAREDTSGTWDAFWWPSEDILPPEEIAAAKRELDELTFEQEYRAQFVSFEGRAYYPFSERLHTAALSYSPQQPLVFCFDFNIAPGVAAVAQEQRLPNGVEGTGVIGEVWIPRNSNTPAVCRKLLADWGRHQGRVICYGDATGGSLGSAKVRGSDWDLIRDLLRAHFGERLYFRIPKANPPERARLNAVNSRLMTMAGEVRLMVDPAKAPHVVQDLEGVRLLEGGAGELDKRHDPMLTHISDALGYYLHAEFAGGPKARIQAVGGLY